MYACVCVFQSEVLGVLEEETWRSFQQRKLIFNQLWANILWISPLNKFSSSQDELPLKAFWKHFPIKSSCWDSKIPGLQEPPKSRVSLQLPLMERPSGTTCRSALCCPFAFGSTRGEESRKVGCWWLLSLDTNHLGFKKNKVERLGTWKWSFPSSESPFFQGQFQVEPWNQLQGCYCWWQPEIRQTQPVEGQVVLSHYLLRVLYMPGGCLGFLNHQQYQYISILQVYFLEYPPIGHLSPSSFSTAGCIASRSELYESCTWARWQEHPWQLGIFFEVENPHKMGQPINHYICIYLYIIYSILCSHIMYTKHITQNVKKKKKKHLIWC